MGLFGFLGRIFAIIGAIIVIVNAIFGFVSIPPIVFFGSEFTFGLSSLVWTIIRVLGAAGIIYTSQGKLDVEDEWLLGIIVIIFSIIAGTSLGVFGGFLIFLGGIL